MSGPHLGSRLTNLGFSVHLETSKCLKAPFEVLKGVGANQSTWSYVTELIIAQGVPVLTVAGARAHRVNQGHGK